MHTGPCCGLRWPAALEIALLALGPPLAGAEALHDHDNGPLTGYFGIPDSTEGSILLEPGASRFEILLLASSHSVNDRRRDEEILLDGQTTRLELNYRRGIRPNLEVGIEVPFLEHQSGSLDPIVDTWHSWFGLSGGVRDSRPHNQIEFLYTDTNGVQLDFARNVQGIGDARLFTGWRFHSGEHHAMALRLGVKLPTGDSKNLLGSGGSDVSLGIAGDLLEPLGVAGSSAYYRVGIVHIGKPDVLGDRHRDYVGNIAFGLGQRLTDRLELRLQAALRGPLFDADVEPLGDPSGTVTFGGNIRLSQRWSLALAVTEDVKVRSAPDVSFQISASYAPVGQSD